MCGIAGVIDLRDNFHSQSGSIVTSLLETLNNRGPDSQGLLDFPDHDLSIGHTRLAIQDLTESGHQPMMSSSQRFSISFNGEIYNHLKLRKDYLSHKQFRGTSDTETILELVEEIGFSRTVPLLKGMFAIFVYDLKLDKFYLARDRIGEKPVAYFLSPKQFIFCSQVNSLSSVIPNNQKEFDLNSIDTFLKLGFIPSPNSIYKNIFKLEPGAILEGNKADMLSIKINPYWNISSDYMDVDKNMILDKNDLKRVLQETVAQELLSDRNLGAFLSGGIDSSLICSIAKEIEPDLSTFSMGFDNESYSELGISSKTAKILSTKHTEIICNERDALELVPNLKYVYDEPFADQSQLPTLLLCRMAREEGHVVCLTGDGGDELFGGYNRHRNINRFLKMKTLFTVFKKIGLDRVKFSSQNRFLNDYLRWIYLGINSSSYKESIDLYLSFLNKTQNHNEFDEIIHSSLLGLESAEMSQTFMNYDLHFYICNDVLVKTDRASMRYGLELRSPFLHPDVVDFSSKLPLNRKIYNGKTKKILKELLSDYLPENLINQPKKGFDVPLSNWLKGDLKSWALDILATKGPEEISHLDDKYLEYINMHMKDGSDYTNHIWPYLMLKDWLLKS